MISNSSPMLLLSSTSQRMRASSAQTQTPCSEQEKQHSPRQPTLTLPCRDMAKVGKFRMRKI